MAKSFDCGDFDLNDYLRHYALKNQERDMVGMTYVALSSTDTRILGYYTIANTSIHRDRMPELVAKGLPKYAHLPAILLGRFAVDSEFAGRGVGHKLMSHALDTSLLASQISAARFIITEAYDSAVTWYSRYDFVEIVASSATPNRRKMFLDLKLVLRAREIANQTLFDDAKTSTVPQSPLAQSEQPPEKNLHGERAS